MSVKKILVLTAATLAAVGTTAAMAGASDNMAMASAPSQSSVYVDLGGGYAQSNWSDFNSNGLIGNSLVSTYTPTSNGQGGFIGGGDLGYNINNNIAVEGGAYYLPKVEAAGTGVSVGGTTSVLTTVTGYPVYSWFGYMAAKLSVAVADNLDLYGKIGAAYRALYYGTPNGVSLNQFASDGSYWAPLFGAGLQYTWDMNWMVGAQYLYLPGNTNVNNVNTAFGAPNAAPEANLYTAFLGYKFMV